VAAGARPLAAPRPLADGRVCWLEGLPQEGGRVVVVDAAADGTRRVRTPAGFNVRSRVHEYGGGACAAQGDTLWFSNFADHRAYEQVGEAMPRPLTPEGRLRFADFEPDGRHRRLIAVCEDHGAAPGVAHAEPTNRLVAIALDGAPTAPRVLAEGADFYAAPRLSPDGRQLAWLQWQHPHMPWQATELWLAEVAADGSLAGARCIAGAEGRTALVQPQWSPDGVLHVVSDASGWWNLQRVHLDEQGRDTLAPLWSTEAEFARPQWVFGQCTYGFLAPGVILAAAIHQGRGRL
jgi:dipeptidyl aminopeptidase/acylaminoacyl peptidase